MVKLSFSRAIILSALGLFLLFAGTSKVMAIGIKIQNSNYDIDSQQLVVKGKLEGFEASTSVTLKSLNTGAQLASQITEKQFSFKIPISSFSDVPCEILVLAGSESATDAVGKGPGGCTRYEYTLTGIVTDEPIPYATVSVTLDGVTYTTTADEFGNYELPILSANLNQLVKIDASATDAETGDSIDFVNLAGSFSRVLDGNANGNVTNVSTASYILAVEANGGSEPTTIEELQDAETSIDATELFELAALIKLIVDDRNYSLPEGETSLIDFISDPSAVETYKETIPQEDLDAALSEILSDSDLVAGFTPDEIPERYYAIPVATPGYIARAGDALEFDPTTNRGSLLSIDGNRGIGINQPFIWEIDTSGRLDITLDAPVVIENFPYIETLDNITEEERSILEANGIGQISELTSIEGYLYTRVTDGTLVDIASLEVRQVRTYPPIPLDGQNFLVLANDEVVDINVDDVTLRSSLDINSVPFTDSCTGSNQTICATGVWGGVFHYPQSPGVAAYSGLPGYAYPATAYGDIATLAAESNSASTTLGSSTGTWMVTADGRLEINYSDGWQQTMEILDSLGIEYGIFSEFTNGSERFATYSVFSRADSSPNLVETDLLTSPGRYFNGEVNSWQVGSFDENGVRIPNRRFGWEFYADATGQLRFANGICSDSGEQQLLLYNTGWELTAEGVVEIDRFTTAIYPGFATRSWFPAATSSIDGDRVLYVLESEIRDVYYGDDDPPVRQLLFPPRINIQREINQHSDYGCSLVR